MDSREARWDPLGMRFDPDKHRAHRTFETACRQRHGDPLLAEFRRVEDRRRLAAVRS